MKINNIILGGLSLLLMVGCDDFETVNTNPDASTTVTSAMLATGLLRNISTMNSGNDKNFIRDELLAKSLSWTEAQDIDLAFNLLGRGSFSPMSNLRNCEKMIEFAATDELKNSYTAFSHFVRVYTFFDLTLRMGDIPYSEALKGESEEIYFPAYDSQRAVFLGMLKELDEADRLFAAGATFEGDYIYNGDVTKWRKAVNVLQLKLLLNLYQKVDDAELNVKGRIQDILANRPIFESEADNFQIIFSNKAGQKYPFFKEINSFTNNDRMTNILIDKLKELKDYRLFYYAKPTPNAEDASMDASDWNAYGGVDPTLPEADILSYVSEGNVSQLNDRYEELAEGEPVFLLSYQEMNFILAEMALRGFISQNPEHYYQEGIRSAMRFVANNTPDNAAYHHNRKLTDDYINSYLASKEVALAANFEEQLKQIIWQKYIMLFLQTPYTAFYEYRRTGVPEFPINPKSNRNTPTDKMPLRWMYPSDELDYNMDNVSQAIASQYGGSDDYMGIMWILK